MIRALLMLALLILALSAGALFAAEEPPAAKLLPEIPVGPVYNGQAAEVSWKALKGRVVLLDFFSFACKPCLKAMPDIVKLQAAHPDRLRVIGYHIGRGSKAEIEPLIARFELNYPMVQPPDHEDPKVDVPGAAFLAQFGSEMLPYTALIDAEGKLRYWNLSPEQVAARVAELLAKP